MNLYTDLQEGERYLLQSVPGPHYFEITVLERTKDYVLVQYINSIKQWRAISSFEDCKIAAKLNPK